MAVTPRRQLRTPSKFSDCILGEELDELSRHNHEVSANYGMEVPTEHIQADGKTNNVSFKTRTERVDKWKQAVFTYFDESNISSLKSAATLKVSLQTEEDK